MCGIFGFITRQGNGVQKPDITDGFYSLHHRGPDHRGRWENPDGSCVLGHTRLSIVDLSDKGNQPMSLSNRYTIVYNGEIYNYQEIKKELLIKGHVFHSNSDTEVILALYHYQKENCLSSLEGMFAFAIWDEVEKTLFCARDRVGEKPFYFNYQNAVFTFASEIKGLWAIGIPREINFSFVYNYLLHNLHYNPSDLSETFYQNITSLKPGHYIKLTAQSSKITQVRYWSINTEDVSHNRSLAEITEEYKELFTRSIKKRLRADVPVGIFLSGGLDSSSIACVVDQLFKNNSPTHVFSSRFHNYKYDEGDYIEIILKKINAIKHQNFLNEDSFINAIDEVFYCQDGPFDGASYIAEYQLMKLVKETGIKVMLDGQGADEILGGYPVYFETLFNKTLRREPWKLLNQLHRYQKKNSSPANINLRALTIAYLPSVFQKAKAYVSFHRSQKLFTKDFIALSGQDHFSVNIFETLNEHLKHHTVGGDLLHMLQCSDKSAMASSVELRMPFLDHNLIEFLFKVPSEYKLKNLQSKHIHRAAMKGILPEPIRLRKDKNGYMAPQENYLQDPRMKKLAHQSLQNLVEAGILKPNHTEWLNFDYMAWRIIMINKLIHYKSQPASLNFKKDFLWK